MIINMIVILKYMYVVHICICGNLFRYIHMQILHFYLDYFFRKKLGMKSLNQNNKNTLNINVYLGVVFCSIHLHLFLYLYYYSFEI